MKIQPEHYAKIEAAMKEVLVKHPDIVQVYAEAGLSNMRLNFDVLHFSVIDGKHSWTWVCEHIYPYANDEHIGTALARIMGNDGKNAKGKR